MLRDSADQFGTDSGTLQDGSGTFPPDLQQVIDAWPELSQGQRDAILDIVAAARG